MGLDMYLTKRCKKTGYEDGCMYWRKANQIHKFFVDQVQDGEDDCGQYLVPFEVLEELKQRCITILNTTKDIKRVQLIDIEDCESIPIRNKKTVDIKLAQELLPAASGFFFGGTNYDYHYINDLERTVENIRQLEQGSLNINLYEFYYQSSW